MLHCPKRKLLKITFIVLIGLLASCSFEGPQDYQKTFETITVSPKLANIFWVSKDHIVMSAHIDTELKTQDYGIYQINVNDGTFVKLIEITDDQPVTYRYCFDGDTLFVSWSRGSFEVLEASVDYKIRIKEYVKKKRTNDYSPLRCGFYEKPPVEGYGFLALRADDGFIKNGRRHFGTDKYRQVFLADNDGNTIKHLMDHKLHPRKPHDLEKMFSVRRFAEHENAYFGQAPFDRQKTYDYKKRRWDIKDCTHLSWLYRENWEAKQKQLCFNDWPASKLILLVKDGLYIQTYSTKTGNPNAYVIQNEKGSVIDDGIVDGSTVSPDGCKVAYAFTEKWELGKLSSLKIFDYCGYVNRPEPSVLGVSLVTGEGNINKERSKKEEPFYFVD